MPAHCIDPREETRKKGGNQSVFSPKLGPGKKEIRNKYSKPPTHQQKPQKKKKERKEKTLPPPSPLPWRSSGGAPA